MQHKSKDLVSIIVSTYNRKDYLLKTVESLLRQKLNNSFDIEIIIVDNDNNNDLYIFYKNYYRPYQKINVYREIRNGVSFARNLGVKKSKGNYVAFIDDDAVADKYWLSNLYDCLVKNNADVAGGIIKLAWNDYHWWIPFCFYYIYGYFYQGDYIKELRGNINPNGSNIIFKKDTFIKYGMFDKSLGRNSVSLLSGEEQLICDKIKKNGGRVYYTPFAVVHHNISKCRITKRYFFRRLYWEGITDAIKSKKNFKLTSILRFFKRIIFSFFIYPFTLLLSMLVLNKKLFFYSAGYLVKNYGYFMGLIKRYNK